MTTAGNETGNSREEELIARVYRQVTVCQADRYARTYALRAGLARFGDWLNEHNVVDPDQAELASAAGNARGRTSVAEILVAAGNATEVKPETLADEAVTELYSSHYRSLVRLAVLLVRDEPTAEEVVQECFIAMHDGWHRLGNQEKALSYLKQAVVNRSRSVLRHRGVIDRDTSQPASDMPSAEQGAISLLERSPIIRALRDLPDEQRQALVLRYYADLSEAQIAEMMGISKGAVKSHTARGMSSLRALLEEAP
jgi:RNA polymerase sigma-70 factor (sigma-E family)